MRTYLIVIALVWSLAGCSQHQPIPGNAPNLASHVAVGSRQPDFVPSGIDVFFVEWGASSPPIKLGPRSTKLFLEMLTRPSVHMEISSMPALPMGAFKAGGVEYLWHGNGVIHGTGNEERMWHGPFTQRLIADVAKAGYETKEISSILNAIEQDPSVSDSTVGGPGAYPGGSDALHPVPTEQFKTFKPDGN